MILSLLAPLSSAIRPASPTIRSSSDEAPVEVAGASETMPARLKFEASVLKYPMLMSELLFELLLPIDTNKLLNVLRWEMKRGAMDYLIQVCQDFLTWHLLYAHLSFIYIYIFLLTSSPIT